ncbi:6389_t:CDS:2 [Rhizophagus irregularis]|nr:6389_t:CDS:2 [Rhizophagus irregularis]
MSNFSSKLSTCRKVRWEPNANKIVVSLCPQKHFYEAPMYAIRNDFAGSIKEDNKENVNEEISIINKVMNIRTGISHYKIVFLSEENNLDPIKSKLSQEE